VTDLQTLAETLVTEYLHGTWSPTLAEDERARRLSLDADVAGDLDALPAGGHPPPDALTQMLRPHPELDEWRLAEVLRAYPGGNRAAQALVRHLLSALAASRLPDVDPYPERYVEAPRTYAGTKPTIFTAGGISGTTSSWQLVAALQILANSPTAVALNPRRAHFPVHDPAEHPAQIRWEHTALHAADVILFWFPATAPHSRSPGTSWAPLPLGAHGSPSEQSRSTCGDSMSSSNYSWPGPKSWCATP
jgi:hypothetical protein